MRNVYLSAYFSRVQKAISCGNISSRSIGSERRCISERKVCVLLSSFLIYDSQILGGSSVGGGRPATRSPPHPPLPPAPPPPRPPSTDAALISSPAGVPTIFRSFESVRAPVHMHVCMYSCMQDFVCMYVFFLHPYVIFPRGAFCVAVTAGRLAFGGNGAPRLCYQGGEGSMRSRLL